MKTSEIRHKTTHHISIPIQSFFHRRGSSRALVKIRMSFRIILLYIHGVVSWQGREYQHQRKVNGNRTGVQRSDFVKGEKLFILFFFHKPAEGVPSQKVAHGPDFDLYLLEDQTNNLSKVARQEIFPFEQQMLEIISL